MMMFGLAAHRLESLRVCRAAVVVVMESLGEAIAIDNCSQWWRPWLDALAKGYHLVFEDSKK